MRLRLWHPAWLRNVTTVTQLMTRDGLEEERRGKCRLAVNTFASFVVGVDSRDCQRGRRALHEHTATVTGCFAARQRKAAGTPGERGGGVRPTLT